MSTIGIIAEFNPFHNGHKYLIEKVKENSNNIVCVLSSDFVQRGDTALFNKETRAKSALLNGADLVIELPVMWSMSGAEKFATGSVSLLKEIGITEKIAFGVNEENILLLKKIALFLISSEFSKEIKSELDKGYTFAEAREKAVKNHFKLNDSILKDGNNILAVEYIKAAESLDFSPEFIGIKRIGALHGASSPVENYSNSTYLRKLIKNNRINDAFKYIPENLYNIYTETSYSDIKNIYSALLFKLRSLDKYDLSCLPDLSEGIENRLYKAIKNSNSYPELLEKLKTKRYPVSRIRRLALNAALQLKENDINVPPYIRVLGFNKSGEQMIKEISKKCSLPIIVNSNQAGKLEGKAKAIFDIQCKITDLYNMSFTNPVGCGSDLKYKTVKL